MRLINAPTAASRDSPAPRLSTHVAAEDGSVFAQLLMRFAKSWSRISPGGKEAAHALAACGSLPAHCEIRELVARVCASSERRDIIWAVADGLSSAAAETMAGRIASRTVGSDKSCVQASAAAGLVCDHWLETAAIRFSRVSPLLFCTAKSAAAFGSVSLHSVSTGSRQFWRVPSSESSSIQASAVCGSDLAIWRAIAPATWSFALPGGRATT